MLNTNPPEFSKPLVDLNEKQTSAFSYTRLIQDLGSNVKNSFELEWSQEYCRKSGLIQPFNGALAPISLRPRMAGLDSKTNVGGRYTVGVRVEPDIVDYLFGQTVCGRLGARFMLGVKPPLQLPTVESSIDGAWVGQNPGADTTAVDAVLGARNLSAHGYQCTTSFSRQLVAQSTPDIEAFVRSWLARRHAIGLDKAVLNGPGTENQPLGILGTPGVQAVYLSGGNGGSASYDLPNVMRSLAEIANANQLASPGFVSTPEIKLKLSRLGSVAGTSGEPVWDGDSCAGDLGLVTNQLPKNLSRGSGSNLHPLLFGFWESLVVVQFDVLSIVVDPFAAKKQNMIEISSLGFYDCILQHPQVFVLAGDLVAT